MAHDDWVTGDLFGFPIPAHAGALRGGGIRFLTNAFRAFGVLAGNNRVTRITEFVQTAGGSTGRKLLLSVEYAVPAPDLPTRLFVKFSRDFDDPIRDQGRTQMEFEVRFASLSRCDGFPIAVPSCQFADYHRDSGTGLLITERIPFGVNGIEPQHRKCLDYQMPDPLAHYQALLTALARLAGAHQSGRLPANLTEQFPLEITGATVGDRPVLDAVKLRRRVAQYAEFAAANPGLLPANVRSPAFISQLAEDVPRILCHEHAIWGCLGEDPAYIALCHWNANVDNAWFWRDADGLHCGLMDWGCVSQMNVAMAIWGAMSGAETDMWDRDLGDLLQLFATEVRRCGGAALDVEVLTRHLMMYAAVMGMTWLLNVPALLRARVPDLAGVKDRRDPRIKDDEGVRAPLQMLTNVMNLWETHRFGELL